jgi:hypothetical protein
LSGLKVPEHEAAHFHLLPSLRMNGIAQYFLCIRWRVHRFIFCCVWPLKLSVGRSVTFVVWAYERREGVNEWQIDMWFTALGGSVLCMAADRQVVP